MKDYEADYEAEFSRGFNEYQGDLSMSYGRTPYYIYVWDEGVTFIRLQDFDGKGLPLTNATVPEEALAQFIASIAARGTEHLQLWIDQGKALRENALPSDLAVQVSGSYIDG